MLAELAVLAPNGVEEERGPGYVEYAIYGGEGELPELGEIDAAVGGRHGRGQRHRDPRRLGRPLARLPQAAPGRRPPLAATLLGAAAARARSTSSSTPARPSAPAPTRPPASASSTCWSWRPPATASGPLTDLGTGSGVLAIAAAKLGWAPVPAYDHEPPALEAAATNAAANDAEIALQRINLRERLPSLAPTVVANMTAPILLAVADQLSNREGGRGMGRRSLPAVAPPTHAPAPSTLVCSGLLPTELDDVAAAFARTGLAEADRRQDGDWAALLLRQP